MKRFLTLCSVLCTACICLIAQTEFMPLTVAVEDLTEPFPETAKVQVANKLNQLLAQNGIASLDNNGQFVLTVFMVPQDKDVLPGPPMQIIESMDATFYVADVAQKIVLSTASQTIKGVGRSETRAYMDALKHLNTNSPAMAKFIQDGKNKIIAYYDSEAPRIIKEAMALSEMHEYERALSMVMVIPSQCKHYDEAIKSGLAIFHAYQDYQCVQNLQKARMAWAAEQNATGAHKAGVYLAEIYPDAACYGEAMDVYKEIKAKVLDDWKFEMKKYQDSVDLEKQRIDAARQVGIAYGNHQQPVSTNIGFLR
ncbi:MAG: hypothetical protein MJZ75_00030 [Paludibacteraceae bacterium]|nr:hypothetical protein [Paludibacteraceae bacterium]